MRPACPSACTWTTATDFEPASPAIDGGFTSVMIDASSKPFAENIEITKKVVEYAHDHGVVVEAELGTLAGIEDEVKVSAHEASHTPSGGGGGVRVQDRLRPLWPSPSAPATAPTSSQPEQCTRNEKGDAGSASPCGSTC